MSKIGDSIDAKVSQIKAEVKEPEKRDKKLKPYLKYD